MLDAVRKSGVLHGYAETEVFAPAVKGARDDWQRDRAGDLGAVQESTRSSRIPGTSPRPAAQCMIWGATVEAARYLFGKDDPILEVMAWETPWSTTTGPGARTMRSSSCVLPVAESRTAAFVVDPGRPRSA